MAVDLSVLMERQVAAVPVMATPLVEAIHPSVAAQLGVGNIPRPGSKEFAKRIPPGAPDGTQVVAHPDGAMEIVAVTPEAPPPVVVPLAPGSQRLVVSFGPQQGKLVVGIETAPNWDMDESEIVSIEAVREMLPILRGLTKVKSLVGNLDKFLESAE